MTTWTSRYLLAFPAARLNDANDLAAILDPDTGGHLTFSIDRQRAGYVYAEIPFVEGYPEIVEGRDAATWRTVVTQLATASGREDIDTETLELLRTSMIFGEDEFAEMGESE